MLCREIFHCYTLSCFKDYIFLFNRIFNDPDEAIMDYDFLCFVLTFVMEFNEKLQQLRKQKEITQEELAETVFWKHLSPIGREIIQQVIDAFNDNRAEIIGVIYPDMIDDQLKYLLFHEAKVHNKKLVILDKECVNLSVYKSFICKLRSEPEA